MLGDALTPLGVVGIAVVVGGVWLVHGGEGGVRAALRTPGVGWAWLTLFSTVGYSLADKAGVSLLSNDAWSGPLPPALGWFALSGIVFPLLFLPIAAHEVPRDVLRASFRRDWPRAAGAVAMSFVGYGSILYAYQTAPASYVVAVRQMSVLFAVGIAMFFLGERPSARRIAGSAATVSGVALIAWGG